MSKVKQQPAAGDGQTVHLFYLGPELTFSHEAARRVQAQLDGWRPAALTPCPTTEEIFTRVLQEPHSGAVVPIYNREQGDVFDFSRFYLLDLAQTLDLTVSFFLFSHADSLDGVETIYTKDTIVPQVDRWLATLPVRIKIVAQQNISSAEAARRAAGEPKAAAICSAAAGEAYRLNRLGTAEGNRIDNFTRFGLFQRPADWWTPPPGLFDPLEFPLGFDDDTAARLAEGEETLCWTVTLSPHTAFHLGHLTTILTLRKFALRGNRAMILWRPAAEKPSLEQVTIFEKSVREIIDTPLLAGFQAAAGPKPAGSITISGLEATQRLKTSGRQAILVDHVPGRDGYAKMSTRRENTILWPLPADLHHRPVVQDIIKKHFGSDRLRQAGLADLFS